MGDEVKTEGRHWSRGTYSLPEELARHTPREWFAPDELRGACHKAGEELGWEDAKRARFRTAAQMVEMWRGLDLPAWEAPYVLRAARLGYLNGYESALISGDMSEQRISNAAKSRWGERWRERLRAARERSGYVIHRISTYTTRVSVRSEANSSNRLCPGLQVLQGKIRKGGSYGDA